VDPDTGSEVPILRFQAEKPLALLSVAANGDRVVAAGRSNLYLLNRRGRPEASLEVPGDSSPIVQLAASEDAGVIAVARASGSLCVYQAGNRSWSGPLALGPLRDLEMGGDGEILVAAARDTVHVLRPTLAPAWGRPFSFAACRVALSRSGLELLVASLDGQLTWLDQFGNASATVQTPSDLQRISASSDLDTVAVTAEGRRLLLLTRQGRPLLETTLPAGVRGLALAENGTLVAATLDDGSAVTYGRDGNPRGRFLPPTGGLSGIVQVLAGGTFLLLSGNDRYLHLSDSWGRSVWSREFPAPILAVGASEDGAAIAVADQARTVHLLFRSFPRAFLPTRAPDPIAPVFGVGVPLLPPSMAETASPPNQLRRSMDPVAPTTSASPSDNAPRTFSVVGSGAPTQPRTPPTPSGGPAPPGTRGPGDPREFLGMDSYARFDLFRLNALDLAEMLRSGLTSGRGAVRQLAAKAEELLPRVRQETEDPAEVAKLVRGCLQDWSSGRRPNTPSAGPSPMRGGWDGLFFESRAAGSHRTARLVDRLLWASHGEWEEVPRAWPLFGARSQAAQSLGSLEHRPPELVHQLQAVQAMLDDLAGLTASAGAALPLTRLSDLGRTLGTRQLNATLQSFFAPDGPSEFLLLDPRLVPGAPKITLVWPDPRRDGGPGLYQLVVGPLAPPSNAVQPAGASAPAGQPIVEASTVWSGAELAASDWRVMLTGLEARGQRLPPPPVGAYEPLPTYRHLRDLVAADPGAARLCSGVLWKDRPYGLGLLARSVSEGTLSFVESSQSDYLEAELTRCIGGDVDDPPADGVWTLPGGRTCRRRFGADGSVTFSLDSVPGSPPASA
jgi:hypothetical protein